MIEELLFRNKTNAIIEELRAKGQLDEDKLAQVLEFRRRNDFIAWVFVFLLSVPLTLFSIFLVHLMVKGVGNDQFLVNVIMLVIMFPFILLPFYIFLRDARRELKNIFLLSFGERTKGTVTLFGVERSQGRRWVEYHFLIGDKKYDCSMQIPHNFDKQFDFKSNESVFVAYDPDNPKSNVIISPRMEMFNVKKEVTE